MKKLKWINKIVNLTDACWKVEETKPTTAIKRGSMCILRNWPPMNGAFPPAAARRHARRLTFLSEESETPVLAVRTEDAP